MINIAQPIIGPEEKQAVIDVLDSGMLAQGQRVKAFEEAFAQICGVKHVHCYQFWDDRSTHCTAGSQYWTGR